MVPKVWNKHVMVYLVLGTVWIVVNVRGLTKIQPVIWGNRTVCVQNYTGLNKIKVPETLCPEILNRSTNDDTHNVESNHNIEGEFYADHNEPTDLILLNLTLECYNNKDCPTTSNSGCSRTYLFCTYLEKHDVEVNEVISARKPLPFTATLSQKKLVCYNKPLVSYHHSRYSSQELETSISPSPGVSFWTDSFLALLTTDEIKELSVEVRNSSSFNNSDTCFTFCLNENPSVNPKVSVIAYNASEGDCQCFYNNTTGSAIDGNYGAVYEVRDHEEFNWVTVTERCIAVRYQSAIEYHVRNCSFVYSYLCGPYRCKRQKTDDKCDYSGDTPETVRETTQPPATQKIVTTVNPDDGGSTNTLPLALVIGSICIVVMLIVGSIFFLRSRRTCRKGEQPMERGRPNSTSNRTYMMQNPAEEDDEELYTSIVEITDNRKPLLPPRNNEKQSGAVTFKTEYSTPSDTVVTMAVTETDVYTDTYDNPMRRSKSDGEIVETTAADTADTTRGSKDDASGYERAACSLDIHGNVVHYRNQDSASQTDYESVRGPGNKKQCQKDDTHSNNELTETSDSNGSANNYFTLTKTQSAQNTDNGNLTDISETGESRIDEGEESSDYEDTSVIGANLGLNPSNKVPSPEGGRNAHNSDDSDEKSLACTISPYLLKQLNIKIVPDDNEYAMNAKRWPKSSSDERLSISNLADGEVGQYFCNNPQQNHFNNNKNENNNNRTGAIRDVTDEYDKLCYVRRVVSAGKADPHNVYYHFVVKQTDPTEKPVTRRASV